MKGRQGMATAKERTLAAEGKTKPAKTKAVMRVVINGSSIVVDAQTLTIRESYLAGQSIEDAGFTTTSQMRVAAIAYIVAKRSHPELTFDDVIDSLTLADLDNIVQEPDDSPEA